MAISVVQEHEHINQPSETSDTVGPIAGVTAGNVLVVVVWSYASSRTVGSITDDQSNTYVEDHESIAGVGFAFYSSVIATGGDLTLTVNFVGGGSGGHNVYVYELSTSTSWPTPHFDAAPAAVQTAATESVTTASFTTAQDNEFIVSALSLGNSRTPTWDNPPNTTKDSPTSGASLRHVGHSLSNTGGSNTIAASWTGGGNTTGRICGAAYKDTAAGGADPEGSLIGGKLLRGGLLMHGVLGR